MESNEKKRILSMYQCTGTFTLGNYLGAFKNALRFQEEGYQCAYALADLHAITVRQEPAQLRKYTQDAYAFLLAMGIDLSKTLFFIQSHVPDGGGHPFISGGLCACGGGSETACGDCPGHCGAL